MIRPQTESVKESSNPGDLILDVSRLSVQFHGDNGPVLAVNDLSFQVRAGERVGIVGESGSGKSVTAQALLAC